MALKATTGDDAEGLEVYNAKRRFERTKEPRGRRARRDQRRFVVQQHDATRMHYDFRLELDGILLSWAVPKGPSLSPAVKRLAVQTEDHPVSYRNFEGEIPAGEYGGGTVIVWDRGRWRAEGDPHEGLRSGHLSFALDGEKLQGRFSLVRTGAKKSSGPKSSWLLFKRSDEYAREGRAAEITQGRPESVISGEPIASRRTGARRRAAPARKAEKTRTATTLPALENLQVQLATLVDAPPRHPGWVYEVKLDGYRMLAQLKDGRVELRSRNGLDWTRTFPAIAKKIASLDAGHAVLDGELCHVGADGITRFQPLQNALPRGGGTPGAKEQKSLVYYVFDLLFLDGADQRAEPLLERKQRLRLLFGRRRRTPLEFVEHFEGDGGLLLTQACAAGFEGLIAKRADAAYHNGRGPEWLKLKCRRRQEFVIVGATAPQGSRTGFGALLLALREGDGWRYAGKVGTGFNERSLKELARLLGRRHVARPPVANPPRLRGVQWVRPELVCEIEFTEMTRDGALRHPSFHGLRKDKPAAEVVAEQAAPVTQVAQAGRGGGRASTAVEAGGVRITHPDRVIDRSSGVTKGELARYHEAIADAFGRFALHRPLAVVRCPDGDAGACFFQKHPIAGTKDIRRKRIDDHPVIYASKVRGLMELVQFNAIEFHGWGARAAAPGRPDWMVFDLDPDPSLDFSAVVDAAGEVREAMNSLGLRSYPKTTGGKGLHVVVPLTPAASWEDVKGFSRSVAEALAGAYPDRFVATMSKARRAGRIFIDYLRNGKGATAVLPYSPRSRPGATVAWPVDWKDLPHLDPREFTVRSVPALLRRRRDPWQDFEALDQRLPVDTPPRSGRRRKKGN